MLFWREFNSEKDWERVPHGLQILKIATFQQNERSVLKIQKQHDYDSAAFGGREVLSYIRARQNPAYRKEYLARQNIGVEYLNPEGTAARFNTETIDETLPQTVVVDHDVPVSEHFAISPSETPVATAEPVPLIDRKGKRKIHDVDEQLLLPTETGKRSRSGLIIHDTEQTMVNTQSILTHTAKAVTITDSEAPTEPILIRASPPLCILSHYTPFKILFTRSKFSYIPLTIHASHQIHTLFYPLFSQITIHHTQTIITFLSHYSSIFTFSIYYHTLKIITFLSHYSTF
ncbi:hypothetical protein Drorol1_Dr00004674 [Drosera rotundifolia]